MVVGPVVGAVVVCVFPFSADVSISIMLLCSRLDRAT